MNEKNLIHLALMLLNCVHL